MSSWPLEVKFDVSDRSTYDALSPLKMAARNGQLLPWTGAGISVDPPAELPGGATLERPLKRAFYRAACDLVTHKDTEWLADLKRQICTFRLEPMLDAVQRVHGRNFIENYLTLLDGETWNENHAVIAAIAGYGFISQCITLNFDCLLELAHASHGRSTTFCPLRNDGFSTGSGPLQLEITKPHGSFYYGDSEERERFDLLCGAISEIGDRPSDANRQAIQRVLERCSTVLVAGYSNHDWDVAPILFELRDLISHVFWIEHAANPKNHKSNARQIQVRKLLRTFAVPSTIVIAHTGSLLRSLAVELGVEIPPLPNARMELKKRPEASVLLETLENRHRTAAATALMLQNGSTRQLLLDELLRMDTLREMPELYAVLLKAAGMTDYSNVRGMIERMSAVARLSPQITGRLRTDDNVWLGYISISG